MFVVCRNRLSGPSEDIADIQVRRDPVLIFRMQGCQFPADLPEEGRCVSAAAA
jgi:hypothetical protein